jgi:DnaK suppressor protein
MTGSQTEVYLSMLRTRQAEIAGSLRHRDEIVIEKAPDALDEVQQMCERELAVRNIDRNSSLLRQIRLAIERAENGAFGICLQCEEEIMPRRLAALPWAAYCILCQEKIDRREIEADENIHFLAPAA